MNQPNSGRVAVITGAGSGIGAATAHRFATDGYTVILIGRTQTTLHETAEHSPHPARMHPMVADTSDMQAITSALDTAADQHGRIDVLINNAAASGIGSIEQTSPEDYRTITGAIDGTVFTSKAALPYLRATRGSIINVGSNAALGGDWGQAVYDMTKGAIRNLTNAMALDHGHEIRVNAIHPGAILTNPFLHDTFTEGGAPHAQFAERVPMGRAGEPAEVAAVIAFLAGADAGYMNGAHICVDGGLTASNGQANFYAHTS
ncbi:SDR family NAD(P)-dependent oxidoreductase [Streptomyces sp. NPDC051217]|uniref:SDR family NAD(P)-dependent oxidoreductase n=1 Tax=Streptomyces sp. NPDC051217 TaxID=3365644 RepID=UPI0037B531F8